MVRIRMAASALAVAATVASAALAPAAQAAPRHGAHHHVASAKTLRHLSVRFAEGVPAYPKPGRHSSGLVALVGDRESGLGFHGLPTQYRSYGRPRRGRGDAIDYAIAAEMGNGYYYGVGGGDYGERHHHLMFNPVDGYGTPFFAGYYGPAGDPDDDRGLFGNPYN